MKEQIVVQAPTHAVWRMWERAHGSLESGQKGKSRFQYEILEVKEGESFSMLWKALFVRLVFTHKVEPHERGALITYQVKMKGLFAPIARFFLAKKIQQNLSHVLKAVALEFTQRTHHS